jgi:hypothetical protein
MKHGVFHHRGHFNAFSKAMRLYLGVFFVGKADIE